MKEFEDKLNDIEAKIANLSIRIGNLEDKNKKKFAGQDDLNKLKKELEELRNAHGQTVIKVNNNKEQIDIILGNNHFLLKEKS